MRRFIFESGIRTWANESELNRRAEKWVYGGFDTVMLQVDDGRGPTWPTRYPIPTSPHIVLADDPLLRAVDILRTWRMSVILVFNFTGFNYSSHPIRPEFWLQEQTAPEKKYNIWDEDFVDWRIEYINDCLGYVPCDAVGLDFLRTARAALDGETEPMLRMRQVVRKIRQQIPPYHTLMSITQSDYYLSPNSQGVDPQTWYTQDWIDKICIFAYDFPFRIHQFAKIDRTDLWVLASTFNENPVRSKTSVELEAIYRHITLLRPEAYGLFTANMLTDEHVKTLKSQYLKIQRRLP